MVWWLRVCARACGDVSIRARVRVLSRICWHVTTRNFTYFMSYKELKKWHRQHAEGYRLRWHVNSKHERRAHTHTDTHTAACNINKNIKTYTREVYSGVECGYLPMSNVVTHSALTCKYFIKIIYNPFRHILHKRRMG